jgi:thiamine biosynthesis lipoprotein
VRWESPTIRLPRGFEIDLGGIGKEYAVDRAVQLAAEVTNAPYLVNFGGDLRVNRPPADGVGWRVGLERPESGKGRGPRRSGKAIGLIELSGGALATSGDTRRFLLRGGVRYSHILDPRTGWPVRDAPRSVTVAAATCVEAGMLATFAMLQGAEAELFLDAQGARSWCLR